MGGREKAGRLIAGSVAISTEQKIITEDLIKKTGPQVSTTCSQKAQMPNQQTQPINTSRKPRTLSLGPDAYKFKSTQRSFEIPQMICVQSGNNAQSHTYDREIGSGSVLNNLPICCNGNESRNEKSMDRTNRYCNVSFLISVLDKTSTVHCYPNLDSSEPQNSNLDSAKFDVMTSLLENTHISVSLSR